MITTIDLRAEAAAETRRLTLARTVLRTDDHRAMAGLEGDGTWIALARTPRLRRLLARRACLVWRAAFEDASGRFVEGRLIPVMVAVPHSLRRRALMPSLLHLACGPVRLWVEAECHSWRQDVAQLAGAFTSARALREREIAVHPPPAMVLNQPGLFDLRADRARHAFASSVAASEEGAAQRLRALAAAAELTRLPARLLLVLLP